MESLVAKLPDGRERKIELPHTMTWGDAKDEIIKVFNLCETNRSGLKGLVRGRILRTDDTLKEIRANAGLGQDSNIVIHLVLPLETVSPPDDRPADNTSEMPDVSTIMNITESLLSSLSGGANGGSSNVPAAVPRIVLRSGVLPVFSEDGGRTPVDAQAAIDMLFSDVARNMEEVSENASNAGNNPAASPSAEAGENRTHSGSGNRVTTGVVLPANAAMHELLVALFGANATPAASGTNATNSEAGTTAGATPETAGADPTGGHTATSPSNTGGSSNRSASATPGNRAPRTEHRLNRGWTVRRINADGSVTATLPGGARLVGRQVITTAIPSSARATESAGSTSGNGATNAAGGSTNSAPTVTPSTVSSNSDNPSQIDFLSHTGAAITNLQHSRRMLIQQTRTLVGMSSHLTDNDNRTSHPYSQPASIPNAVPYDPQLFSDLDEAWRSLSLIPESGVSHVDLERTTAIRKRRLNNGVSVSRTFMQELSNLDSAMATVLNNFIFDTENGTSVDDSDINNDESIQKKELLMGVLQSAVMRAHSRASLIMFESCSGRLGRSMSNRGSSSNANGNTRPNSS